MKTILRKTILLPVMLAAFLLTSCENEDWRLEEEIIGSWSYYYEDDFMFEEEEFSFTPSGNWTYRYNYQSTRGEYQSEVDGGTYEISYGRLLLYSNFYRDQYTYDVEIYGNRLVLRNGEYRGEFVRFR